MRSLHAAIRAGCAASLALALLLGAVSRHVGAASGGPSLAGHWVAQLLFQTDGTNCQGDPICPLAKHAPGPVTLAATFDIVSNAAGRVTFTYEATVAGVGGRVSPQCTARLWGSTAFTGLCPLTAHGTGAFSALVGGVPYLYVGDEWVTFHGTKPVREVHNPMAEVYPYAPSWPVPAQPGHYRDDLPDLGPATSGYHVEEVVARY